MINVFAGLVAYCFYDHKLTIVVPVERRLYP